MLAAWYCWNNVADSPADAWFLTRRERVLAVRRVRESGMVVNVGGDSEKAELHGTKKRALDMRDVFTALKDPKSYLTAVSVTLHHLHALS